MDTVTHRNSSCFCNGLMGFKLDIFLPEITTWIITIFWVIGITNAFNLLDGADGLASGVGIISALILAGIMFFGNQPLVGLLLLDPCCGNRWFFKV